MEKLLWFPNSCQLLTLDVLTSLYSIAGSQGINFIKDFIDEAVILIKGHRKISNINIDDKIKTECQVKNLRSDIVVINKPNKDSIYFRESKPLIQKMIRGNVNSVVRGNLKQLKSGDYCIHFEVLYKYEC